MLALEIPAFEGTGAEEHAQQVGVGGVRAQARARRRQRCSIGVQRQQQVRWVASEMVQKVPQFCSQRKFSGLHGTGAEEGPPEAPRQCAECQRRARQSFVGARKKSRQTRLMNLPLRREPIASTQQKATSLHLFSSSLLPTTTIVTHTSDLALSPPLIGPLPPATRQ